MRLVPRSRVLVVLFAAAGLLATIPATFPAGAAVAAPSDPPTNVACLPFPEKDIVTFNGGGTRSTSWRTPTSTRPIRAR